MGKPPVVQVKGARELRASLKKAGHSLDDLKEAHRKAADIVANKAADLAPRRPGSGRLADSIRPGATKTAGIVRAGNRRKQGVPYAPPIHWGWPRRKIKPNPFITNAAQATETVWVREYMETLEKIIDSIEGAPHA